MTSNGDTHPEHADHPTEDGPGRDSEGAALAAAIRAAHADLHASVADIDAATLETTAVVGSWSVRNVSGNLLDWVEIITAVIEGRPAPTVNVQDFDAYNAEREALHAATPWPTLLAALDDAIERAAAGVAALDDAALQEELVAPWGHPARLRDVIQVIPHHHHEHLAEITPWALREQLRLARTRFSTATAHLSTQQLETIPVCGIWTWSDLAGHLADWAQEGNLRLSAALDGAEAPEPIVTDEASGETWNAEHAAARTDAGKGWEANVADFNATLDTLDGLLERAGTELTEMTLAAPWGGTEPAVELLHELATGHINEHIAGAAEQLAHEAETLPA